jgi:membrane protease subunit (stomatin/prohibitin family)
LGLIRLRAFGVFNLCVLQPVLLINRMVGTQGIYTTEAIEEYLNQVIVSRFNDYMGEMLDSIINLPAQYDELSQDLVKRLQEDFSHFGLGLTHLYINAITPPPEVQKAIDDRSRVGVFDDMSKLMQMKAAMAMEKASEADGDAAAGAGMGAGIGLMLPAMFAQYFGGAAGAQAPKRQDVNCPECKGGLPADARFCPHCGHQQLVFRQCIQCGKNLTPGARFCSRCGQATEAKPSARVCAKCQAENLSDAVYCVACGEKL